MYYREHKNKRTEIIKISLIRLTHRINFQTIYTFHSTVKLTEHSVLVFIISIIMNTLTSLIKHLVFIAPLLL